ncbi:MULTISPECIES: hypothetical protein [Bradyrhizobium]|uniref:hypothetical protein n=1 Tax=Bradyrhizobium TaxID=374 RepID=UPI001EDB888D|nr:hypothetical protein [Bradyrhizobium zhengyangense]MCG2642573.1 hypothetical protein [Bradyrhizobium zhengyangense]
MIDQQYQREILRVARSVLNGIRVSLEAPYAAQHRQKTAYAAVYKTLMLELESLRLPLTAAGRNHLEPEDPLTLAKELAQLRQRSEFGDILRSVTFRMGSGDPHAKPQDRFYGRFTGSIKVADAILMLEDLLLEGVDLDDVPIGNVSVLRGIVPDQKIAPVQFDIIDNVIVVVHKKSLPRDADLKNIEAAKAELSRSGEKIIAELQQSNCDKRLLSSVQELQGQFRGEIDAISVGLKNIGCEAMFAAFESELPVAVSSMLLAYTRGVQMFVGQFPEWTIFVENAAAADLGKSDIDQLRVASASVVQQLSAQPDLVSPEVPRTLAFLTELLGSPTEAGKRAAFALMRSVENLVSRAFGYGTSFLERTADKTIDQASTAASKIIVGMLLLGVGSAVAVGPISSKIPDMNWMKAASEIVKKQLSEIGVK